MKDRCPPHKFEAAGFDGLAEPKAWIFCRACGDIRELDQPMIPAPDEEKIPAKKEER